MSRDGLFIPLRISHPLRITGISEAFRLREELHVPDLRSLVIPVRLPLVCEVYFDSQQKSSGLRLIVSVNGDDVIELSYDGDAGRKQASVDISSHIKYKDNDFRIRCLVACHPLNEQSDTAIVWLHSTEGTVIRKQYRTHGTLEPFDQRWTLHLAEDPVLSTPKAAEGQEPAG